MDIQTVISIGAATLGLLMTLNVFFIRRLVSQIDAMGKAVEKIPVHQNELKNISDRMDSLEHKFDQMSREFKDIGAVRERLAVLEFAIKAKKPLNRGN